MWLMTQATILGDWIMLKQKGSAGLRMTGDTGVGGVGGFKAMSRGIIVRSMTVTAGNLTFQDRMAVRVV